MNKTARTLIKYLDSKGLFVAATSVYNLASYAGIEDHREKIDEAGETRGAGPFEEWFSGKERVYIPYGEKESTDEEKEILLKEEFKNILNWVEKHAGETPDETSLLYGRMPSGRRIGGKFFHTVLRKELALLHEAHEASLTEDKRNFVSTIFNQFGQKGIRNKYILLLKDEYNKLQGKLSEQGNTLKLSIDDIYKTFLNDFEKNNNKEEVERKAAEIYNNPASWSVPNAKPPMSQESFVFHFSGPYILRESGDPEGQLGAAIEDNKLISVKGIDKFSLNIKINNLIYNIKSTMDEYLSSPLRGNLHSDGDYLIVISKDPTDIAGMSTEKRWTSCMSLDGGSHSSGVYCEIIEGGFIAYLINKDDKEVSDPLARYRIRRFESVKTRESVAIMEDSMYSDNTEYPGFMEAVQGWIDSKQGPLDHGVYSLKGGGYSDTFEDDGLYVADETSGSGGTIENLSKIVLNPELIKREDTYTVMDDLHIEHSDEYQDDLDDYDIKLEITNLGENGIVFSSGAEAREWIAAAKDYWRNDLSEFIWSNSDFSYEIDPEYDIEENEENLIIQDGPSGTKFLTSRGEAINMFATGERDRYSITHTTEEKYREEALATINKSLAEKMHEAQLQGKFDPSGVSDELFRSLRDAAEASTGPYRMSRLVRTFPERFTDEEIRVSLTTSGKSEADMSHLAEAYSNMKDSPKREELRTSLISSLLLKLDYESLRDGFKRENRTEGAVRRKDGAYGSFEVIWSRRVDSSILSALSKGGALRSNMSDKLIENYRLADKEYLDMNAYVEAEGETSAQLRVDPLTATGANDIKRDMLSGLRIMNAHDPRSISFYTEELKKIKITDRRDMGRGMISPGKPPEVRDYVYAAAKTGISGTSLIPELERLFGESQALTSNVAADHAFKKEWAKDLNKDKKEFGNIILTAITAIREGS
jgi:hypothetical protein